jgi:hypothetical protein
MFQTGELTSYVLYGIPPVPDGSVTDPYNLFLWRYNHHLLHHNCSTKSGWRQSLSQSISLLSFISLRSGAISWEGGLNRSPGGDVANGVRSPDSDQACQLHARNRNVTQKEKTSGASLTKLVTPLFSNVISTVVVLQHLYKHGSMIMNNSNSCLFTF